MSIARKNQSGPYYYSKAIGPKEAEELLAANVKNRRLSNRVVSKYARDMAAGNWMNNGDVIRISTDGLLLDGQHRLSAIIESGVTVVLNFVEGLDPGVFKTIDLQRRRNTADFLEMAGFKNAPKAAAVAKKLIHWENTADKTRFTFNNDAWQKITEQEQLEYVQHNDDEIQRANEFLKGSFPYKKCGSPSSLVTAMVICQRFNFNEAYSFFEKLKTGTSLEQFSPIALLRDRLVDPPDRRGVAWDLELMALVVKSFNKWTRGETLKTLRWRHDGDAPEKFPIPGK